jgi:hypothetical protein
MIMYISLVMYDWSKVENDPPMKAIIHMQLIACLILLLERGSNLFQPKLTYSCFGKKYFMEKCLFSNALICNANVAIVVHLFVLMLQFLEKGVAIF